MVVGYHIIIAAYGFWLPNDPRGSWSTWVRKWDLLRFGQATKVETRQSVASRRHDSEQRKSAKNALAYPPVHFTGVQARAIAMGFKTAIEEAHYHCVACSVMPEHVHLVILRHQRQAEAMIQHLKARATMRLRSEHIHPLLKYEKGGVLPSPWARHGWKVFLDEPRDVARAIRYVEQNPIKDGLPIQQWSFVEKYEPAADGGQARPLNG